MTTTDLRCGITELRMSECAHCRAKRPSFVAAYDGTCATCDQPIDAGQHIRELEDGSYEHARHH